MHTIAVQESRRLKPYRLTTVLPCWSESEAMKDLKNEKKDESLLIEAMNQIKKKLSFNQ